MEPQAYPSSVRRVVARTIRPGIGVCEIGEANHVEVAMRDWPHRQCGRRQRLKQDGYWATD